MKMRKKYPVITLCGSTRFKNEFLQAQKELTLDGYIVLSVGLFGHAGDGEVWEGFDENTLTRTKIMLDDMHKEKIRMADSIFVVNPNGYIGNSTWSEICYAKMLHKEIQFMCPIETNLIEAMVERHIREAERLAWQQLDGIRHTDGDGVDGYVYFKHKRKIILDPWISLEAHYDGSPWADHKDPAQAVNPFEYYGNEKIAWFVEEIIMRHGGLENEL